MKHTLEDLVQTLCVRWKRELWQIHDIRYFHLLFDYCINCIYVASVASPGGHEHP